MLFVIDKEGVKRIGFQGLRGGVKVRVDRSFFLGKGVFGVIDDFQIFGGFGIFFFIILGVRL